MSRFNFALANELLDSTEEYPIKLSQVEEWLDGYLDEFDLIEFERDYVLDKDYKKKYEVKITGYYYLTFDCFKSFLISYQRSYQDDCSQKILDCLELCKKSPYELYEILSNKLDTEIAKINNRLSRLAED